MSATVSTSPSYVYPGIAGTASTSASSSSGSTTGPGATAAGAMGTVEEPVANPTAPAGMTWQSFKGEPPLFGSDGPKAGDVVQGSLDDCFVASSLADIAQSDPNWIKQNIKQVGAPDKPEYQVSLQYQGVWMTVTVDDKLLSKDGKQASMGRSSDGTVTSAALWPAIYEKAYALASTKDVNSTINSGGYPSDPLTAFTGQRSAEYNLPASGDFARQVQSGKYDMSLDTLAGISDIPGWDPATKSASLADGKYTVKGANANAVTITDNTTKKTYSIAMPHCYSVQGVQSTDPNQPDPTKVTPDKLSVSLYNPWGQPFTDSQGLKAVPYDLIQSLFAKQGASLRPAQQQPASA